MREELSDGRKWEKIINGESGRSFEGDRKTPLYPSLPHSPHRNRNW